MSDQDKKAPDDADIEAMDDETATGTDAQAEEPVDEAGIYDAEALTAEIAELKDKLLRSIAETENLRRRAEREREEARAYAATAFARDMLNVGDNMNRALESLDAETRENAGDAIKTLIDGIELTQRELLNVFERHGIRQLDPAGEKFDPNFHQAMFELEDETVPSGTVVQVVQSGFKIGQRVLRPAMVGVSKGGPKTAPATTSDEAAAETAPEGSNDNDPATAADAQSAARSHEDAAAPVKGKKAGKTVDRSA